MPIQSVFAASTWAAAIGSDSMAKGPLASRRSMAVRAREGVPSTKRTARRAVTHHTSPEGATDRATAAPRSTGSIQRSSAGAEGVSAGRGGSARPDATMESPAASQSAPMPRPPAWRERAGAICRVSAAPIARAMETSAGAGYRWFFIGTSPGRIERSQAIGIPPESRPLLIECAPEVRMEKIVSVLWKPAGVSDADFGKQLREVAPELARLGAQQVRVNVVDEHVEAGVDARVGSMDPPKAACITFWLDAADDLEGPLLGTLASRSAKVAAYLVVESIPMHDTEHTVPAGDRTPGFNLVTAIVPKEGLPYDEFLSLWHHEHRKVAVETQSTFAYVRNEIVRALTPDAPDWAAIVEESFPIEALTDPSVWYAAEGDPERHKEHLRRMIESCTAFLALDRVESHPMSEYVF